MSVDQLGAVRRTNRDITRWSQLASLGLLSAKSQVTGRYSGRVHADDIFRAIGRFSVKFRWVVVVLWIAAAVVIPKALPSLASVTQGNNSNFLPASAPSEQAATLAAPFGGSNEIPVPVIAAVSSGTFTAADQAWLATLSTDLGKVPTVVKVNDLGVSAARAGVDGQAAQLQVLSNVSQNNQDAQTDLVNNLRAEIKDSSPPPGVQAHLAGSLAIQVDQQKQSGNTGNQVELVAALFILILLFLIFRALLAPFITLIPAFLSVAISGPVVAELANHGLKVSIARATAADRARARRGHRLRAVPDLPGQREPAGGPGQPRRRGQRADQGRRVDHVLRPDGHRGAAVAARRQLPDLLQPRHPARHRHRHHAAGRADPAAGAARDLRQGRLLAVEAQAGDLSAGLWGNVATRVVKRPAAALLIGVIAFGALSIAVTGYKSAGFGGTISAPAGSDSAAGQNLLAKYFPSSSANPTNLVYKLSTPAWEDPAVIAAATTQLQHSPLFTGVTGPLNPVGGAGFTPAEYTALHAALGSGPLPATAPAIPAAFAGKVTPTQWTQAYQEYRATAQYVDPAGTTIQFQTGLTAGDPSSTAALNAVPALRAEAATVGTTLHATANGVGGEAPAFYDVSQISNSDLAHVIPIAIIVIGVLLALVMRSLVAPIYLIASVAISYFAALGFAVIVFIWLGNSGGITFILPFLLFIFLLALGEDYNILVMTRIREEAHHMPLREAVSRPSASPAPR